MKRKKEKLFDKFYFILFSKYHPPGFCCGRKQLQEDNQKVKGFAYFDFDSHSLVSMKNWFCSFQITQIKKIFEWHFIYYSNNKWSFLVENFGFRRINQYKYNLLGENVISWAELKGFCCDFH